MRMFPERAWSATDLRRVLGGRDDSADSLAWLRGVNAVVAQQRDAPVEAGPDYWASRFDALLDAWNWPGSQSLSSDEFQLVNRWRELLNDLARTSLVMPRLGLSEATERIVALADEVVFQPEADNRLV